jgi:hypothetical protein
MKTGVRSLDEILHLYKEKKLHRVNSTERRVIAEAYLKSTGNKISCSTCSGQIQSALKHLRDAKYGESKKSSGFVVKEETVNKPKVTIKELSTEKFIDEKVDFKGVKALTELNWKELHEIITDAGHDFYHRSKAGLIDYINENDLYHG